VTSKIVYYSWDAATISDYKPLTDTTGWDRCPSCKEYPRTWVFDNGNYAKCRCGHKYEGGVAAETVVSACGKRGVDYSEYKGYLRAAWNARCISMIPPSEENYE